MFETLFGEVVIGVGDPDIGYIMPDVIFISRSDSLRSCIDRLSHFFESSSMNISFKSAQSNVFRRFTRRDIRFTPRIAFVAASLQTCNKYLITMCSNLFKIDENYSFSFFRSQSRVLFLIRVRGGVLPYSSISNLLISSSVVSSRL